ncbi:unnamed protein product [Vitrella brassicaformis CCMP3155]|uniref:Bms1-type G domain-containing protein n=2 Tax=Vitrella brassicaformis TaxID=1169539 RepID=A0A0G4FYK4_VITBC|nr:unnamed protein product [Vitrella brassicaformis CCMP3155]|eukprot:CEM20122.1 unnamed protein product [Vitrella brassicaformis CCMP3155]
MDSGEAKAKKQHKPKSGGAKVKREKKEKDLKSADRHNPRAFSFSGGATSVRRTVQRSLELQAKREKAEVIDKTPDVPPPFIVVVQGPPKVGKTTLIRSLVKHYCKHSLSDVRGPVTLVSSKSRRLTFVECPKDMHTMLDLAKIADLVLLMIDASFGFEMETFEFLNLLQVHGFPRILGVLTHLDSFQDNKRLRKTKKKMKNRFWTEIYDGAKLFYLSGLQYGRYNKTEIANLARFVAVQKFAPLSWRSAHPYLLSLRFEEQTPPHLPPTHDRTAWFYGYIKGARFREGQMVHIPGAGDFPITNITESLDPCQPPEDNRVRKDGKKGEVGSRTMRTLKARHRSIYAPGCDVGTVAFDADAMYIKLPDHKVAFTRADALQAGTSGSKDKEDEDQDEESDGDSDEEEEEEDENGEPDDVVEEEDLPEAVALVRNLQVAESKLDEAVRSQKLQLLPRSSRLINHDQDDVDSDDMEEDDDDEEEEPTETTVHAADGRVRRRVLFDKKVSDRQRRIKEKLDPSRLDEETGNQSEKERQRIQAELDDDDYDDDIDQEMMQTDESWQLDTNNHKDNHADMANGLPDDEDEEPAQLEPAAADEPDLAEQARLRFERPPSLSELVYGGDGPPERRWELLSRSWGGRKGRQGVDKACASGGGGLWQGLQYGLDREESDHQRLSLFEDDESDEEEMAAKVPEGAPSSLLGYIPPDVPLADGSDCSKIPLLAFVASVAPTMQPDTDARQDETHSDAPSPSLSFSTPESLLHIDRLWTPSTLAALKATFFITGGGLDEDDKAANNDKQAAEEKPKVEQAEAETGEKTEEEKRRERAERQALISEAVGMPSETGQGLAIGTYVRVTVEGIPPAWMETLQKDPFRPVLLGGILPGESGLGMMQVKIKKHRWAPRILKANDVLLVSMGWRRFQSLPLYAIEDRNGIRTRMLKYTPEHLHCTCTFYGPTTPPSTGVVAIRRWDPVVNFRVSATGVVLETSPEFKIVKKLKLVGEPYKIFKNTAFIKNMFSSSFEVSKCIGAKLQTVSGIRGQIKKSLDDRGSFRATFEDRILMSDIVICKAWIKVEPKRFYNPVLDVGTTEGKEGGWRRMKTIAELRQERQVPIPHTPDSDYGAKPYRPPRKFNPLKIPKELQKNLPFASKPKLDQKQKRKTDLVSRMTRVGLSDYEKSVATLLGRLHTIQKNRVRLKQETSQRKRLLKQKLAAKDEARRAAKRRELKRDYYRMKGKEEAKMRKKMRLDDE